MRFMFCVGGGGDNLSSAGYEISFVANGKSLGMIGHNISPICPASMIVTGDGTLLVATGYGPVLRMRQNEKTLTEAGVPGPVTQPRIAKEDEYNATPQPAKIIKHFDYSRFGSVRGGLSRSRGFYLTEQGQEAQKARLDDLTKYKPLFSLSAAPNPPVQTPSYPGEQPLSTKTQYQYDLFTGYAQFVVGGDISNLISRWTYISFDVVLENQAAPTTGQTYSGTYQCFMRYVDKDGKYSNPSPISVLVTLDQARYIQYTNLEVPTDQRVRRRQIFRNENGNTDVFYLDIDTEDLTSTALTSFNTDDQLKLNFGQNVWDDNNYNLFNLYSQPPSDKPYMAEFAGRVFYGGFKRYSEGNAIVSNGSATITGIGTQWQKTFVGRQFIDNNDIYTIIGVDEDAQTMTTDPSFKGVTNPYASYVILPYYSNSNLMWWSEPGEPESVPIQAALLLPEDGDEVTGLVTFANSLWVLKTSMIYQFNTTIDPNRDGDYKPVSNRGCVNQRCAVQIQSVCLMIDRTGIHVFRGMLPRNQYQVNSTPDHLSKPIADLFRFEGTWLRINWDSDKCFWHAAHCEELTVVRWYVTLRGYRYPQHAICFDYVMDRWWLEEYPFPITASAESTALSGRPLLGGKDAKVYQPDYGALDLIGTHNTRHTVTDHYFGMILVLDEEPPAEVVGGFVAIVSGKGRGQQALVLSVDGNEVSVDIAFDDWPDDTSVIQFGAIKFYALTAQYDYAKLNSMAPQEFALLYVGNTVTLNAYIGIIKDDATIMEAVENGTWGSISTDKSDPTVWKVDLSNDAGVGKVVLDGFRERDVAARYSVQAWVEGFSGEERPYFIGMQFIGASTKPELNV